jgi:hypothetical protein
MVWMTMMTITTASVAVVEGDVLWQKQQSYQLH